MVETTESVTIPGDSITRVPIREWTVEIIGGPDKGKTISALQGLIRSRYAEDSLKVIGFYTYASPLTERELLRSAPKPVSIFDSRVFLRISLDNPPDFVPEHFTNILAGLKFARQSLTRQPAANKQIICVTDGEPTAHIEDGDVFFQYPPTQRTIEMTLREVVRCTREDITINTFLLESTPHMQWFLEDLMRINKGRVIASSPTRLGSYVLRDFLRGRSATRGSAAPYQPWS